MLIAAASPSRSLPLSMSLKLVSRSHQSVSTALTDTGKLLRVKASEIQCFPLLTGCGIGKPAANPSVCSSPGSGWEEPSGHGAQEGCKASYRKKTVATKRKSLTKKGRFGKLLYPT